MTFCPSDEAQQELFQTCLTHAIITQENLYLRHRRF